MLRVVKLGGSLLDMPDLAARLRAWLAAQTSGRAILVIGGGAHVDAIRRAQGIHHFSDSAAHWLAIRAMALQAEMMRSILPEAEFLVDVSMPQPRGPAAGTQLGILEPWRFMREVDARRKAPLPESWDVTSDSIAARVAELSAADELILLKSALAPSASLEDLAAAGYVDRFFPQAAKKLQVVRLVDLRANPARECVFRLAESGSRSPVR